MSKSLGNHIPLLSSPEDMYGKVMSIPDKAMGDFFRLVTRFTPPEIAEIEQGLKDGSLHPRDVKMKLAKEIVEIYHSPGAAEEAEQAFIQVFQKGDTPDEMETFTYRKGMNVIDVLEASGMVESRNQGKRMVQQNAVSLDDEKITDAFAHFEGEGVLRVGKRKFVRVVKAS